MALGSDIKANFDGDGQKMIPISARSAWQTVIDAGGMDDTDGSGNPTNPETQIDGTDHHDLLSAAKKEGTTVLFRVGYDDALSGVTSPVVRVFGKFDKDDTNEIWTMLPDANGSTDLTCTVDTTNDVADGTLKYTKPVSVDGLGFNDFRFGVKTAIAGTGTVTNAIGQAKLI